MNDRSIFVSSLFLALFVLTAGCTSSQNSQVQNRQEIKQRLKSFCSAMEQGDSEKVLKNYALTQNSSEYKNLKSNLVRMFNISDYNECSYKLGEIKFKEGVAVGSVNITYNLTLAQGGRQYTHESSENIAYKFLKVGQEWKIKEGLLTSAISSYKSYSA